MADLERERALAQIEQEMMEKLKAEELMFQQVRQESSEGTGMSSIYLSVAQPKC